LSEELHILNGNLFSSEKLVFSFFFFAFFSAANKGLFVKKDKIVALKSSKAAHGKNCCFFFYRK
jgi:hypothetical protein